MGIYAAMLLTVIATNKGRESEQTVTRKVLWRFLTFMGYISYGLYLLHPFVWAKYGQLTEHTWWNDGTLSARSELVTFAFASVISIAIAYLSRRFFEDPLLKLKERFAPSKKRSKVSVRG
jgi:peptidoglycan/LPS O-acetylase OafA/YrhL